MNETLDSRLQPIVAELVRARLPLRQAVDEFEQKLIRAALAETGGNVTMAAQMLGVHRNTLHGRMQAKSPVFRKSALIGARARWRR